MRNKILMTLALLLTAVTGAWAEDTYNVTFKANGNTKTVENITLPHTFGCSYNGDLGRGTGELDVIIQELYGLDGGTCASVFPESDNASVTSGVDNGDNQYIIVNAPFNGTATVTGIYYNSSFNTFNYSLEISIPGYTAGPKVAWDPATKTGNFVMPAYDVELTPIYAPVAQWAKVEGVDQLPTAIEGVIADTDAPLIVEGTVAFAGTSTEVKQGTVMYAVTPATVTEAPALDAANKWSADVPTAKLVADGGIDVLVWYYIKGADTPEGQEATAENTFNDSEICTEPITVTVLTNKFDIQFKAANDNTIEAGKATVKVGDEAAEVDAKGNLTGVKMNSKVTITAKEGYKFRKVEVKKGAAPNTITVTWNGADITGTGGGKSFTKDGVTITADDIEFMDKNFLGGGTFTTTLGNFTKIEVTTEGWYASGTGWSGSTWTGNASSVSFSGDIMGYGGDNLKFVFTIEPTN